MVIKAFESLHNLFQLQSIYFAMKIQSAQLALFRKK